MTKEDFAQRATAMRDRLYRVSATLLRRECDREDAVQEALLTALRRLPALRNEDKFEAWLMRILINTCYDQLRRAKREISVDTIPDVYAAPEGGTDLFRYFHQMEEKYRLPMVLHYVEGYEVREVARLLRLPEGTVKSRLMRGRAMLKKQMEEEDES